jgi:hypothetical protein
LALAVPIGARAACPDPLTVKDASAATQNISTTVDANGYCFTGAVLPPLTSYHLSGGTAASNNAGVIKASPGVLHEFAITYDGTGTAAANYLKFYDTASTPTCSSATNIKRVFAINLLNNLNGLSWASAEGLNFANGIAYCIVTGSAADTSNGNATTGLLFDAGYR